MAKLKLEFDLSDPSDTIDSEIAVNAHKYYMLLCTINEKLRMDIKHGTIQCSPSEYAQNIRNMILDEKLKLDY